MRGLLALAVLVCVLVACGGAGENGDKTPEEALSDRAAEFFGALGDENFLRAHSFTSPRFREICLSGEWGIGLRFAVDLIKGIGGGEDSELEWRVSGVTVEGDTGSVDADILLDGVMVDFSDESDASGWVLVDGQWWQEADDWEEGCES